MSVGREIILYPLITPHPLLTDPGKTRRFLNGYGLIRFDKTTRNLQKTRNLCTKIRTAVYNSRGFRNDSGLRENTTKLKKLSGLQLVPFSD